MKLIKIKSSFNSVFMEKANNLKILYRSETEGSSIKCVSLHETEFIKYLQFVAYMFYFQCVHL